MYIVTSFKKIVHLFQIRIHLKKPFVAIDAVEVTSVVGHDQCSHCLPQQYAVTRQPAFGDSDIMVTVNQAMYTDQ